MAKDRRKNADTPEPARSQASPDHEDIARRAHEIWRARGGDGGHELDDWLTAERELRSERPSRRRSTDASERSATP